MRTRDEIDCLIFGDKNEVKPRGFTEQKIIIDLLLDIRDLLIATKEELKKLESNSIKQDIAGNLVSVSRTKWSED